MKLTLYLLAITFFVNIGTAFGLEGQVHVGIYTSPSGLFRVSIPVMRNPFIKVPDIHDRKRKDGGEEVTFSVMDLGEIWRMGIRPFPRDVSVDNDRLIWICNKELERWHGTDVPPQVVVEEKFRLADGMGLSRIYYVESASILFVDRQSTKPKKAGALIGIIVTVSTKKKQVLYSIGQFDMPNRGGHFEIETDRGRTYLAEEHLKRMQEIFALLSLPGSDSEGIYTSSNHLFSVTIPRQDESSGLPYTVTPLGTGGDRNYDKVMFHTVDFGQYLVAGVRKVPTWSLDKMRRDKPRTVLRNLSQAILMGVRRDLDEVPDISKEAFFETRYGEAILRVYHDKKDSSLISTISKGVMSIFDKPKTVNVKETYITSIVARKGPLVVFVLSQKGVSPDETSQVEHMAAELFHGIKILENK